MVQVQLTHEKTALDTAGFYPVCLDAEDALIVALRSEKLLETTAALKDLLPALGVRKLGRNGEVGWVPAVSWSHSPQ